MDWNYLALPKGCRGQDPGIALPDAQSDNIKAAPREKTGIKLKKLGKMDGWENVLSLGIVLLTPPSLSSIPMVEWCHLHREL